MSLATMVLYLDIKEISINFRNYGTANHTYQVFFFDYNHIYQVFFYDYK